MTAAVRIDLPPEAVEQIVADVVSRVREELASASPWMTRTQTAAYLSVPLSRLEKDRTIPCHRWDGRVLYDRREVDGWLLQQGNS